MKKQFTIKTCYFGLKLTVLLFTFMLISGQSWGQYSGTGTFSKITSLTDLADGYYVVAYGTTFAMNNTNAGSYFGNTAISPSSNTITDPSTAIVWKIQTHIDGGRTIYNEASSKYVSYTGSSNAAYAVATVSGGSERWTFAWSSTVFTVRNVTSSTRLLQYNISAPRFACYTGTQQNITLYKLAVTPTIATPSPTSLTGFTSNYGTASSSQTFTISASDLTADLVITAPTGYEVRENGTGSFGSSVSFTPSSGTVSSKTIEVRITSSASVGSPSGNVVCSSTGASSQNVAVDGTVSAIAPSVTTTAVSSIGTTTATFNGDITVAGGLSITDRGFSYKTSTGVDISDNQTSEGGAATGTFSKEFTGLAVNVQYFYKAYATNSIGTTLSSTEISFYTLANTPLAPTVNNATENTLDVTINVNSNPASTEFAIQDSISSNYVQVDGSLGVSAVWQNAANWATKTVTGLTANTSYTFHIKARNGAGTETAFGSTASLSTLAGITPTLSVSAINSFGSRCIFTPGINSFTITGTNLTTADVTVAALAYYTYSTSLDGTYTSTLTIPQSGGSFSQEIFVKFLPYEVKSYNGDIVIGGGGASNVNRSVVGSGINTAPTITTPTSESVTLSTAILGGNVENKNCSYLAERGIYWSTTDGFIDGTGTKVSETGVFDNGVFTVSVSGLSPSTTYYYKAFARNNGGTVYTSQGTYTTPTPTLSVSVITSFGNQCINTTSSANSFTITGTNLTTADVTVAALNGYTYSTTLEGAYTSTLTISQGGGSFSQEIFVKFTPTVVQSYDENIVIGGGGASNVNCSVVGSGVNTVPSITTISPATSIAATTVTLSGDVTSEGCQSVTVRGICYGTSSNPDFSGTKTSEIGTTGIFSSNISDILPNTLYHFRAYVASITDTIYGSDVTFTTNNLSAPTTTAATSITSTGYTANWDAVVGATNYKLDVSTTSAYVINVISENFVGFTTNNGSTNRSSSLDTYLQTTGWTGAAIYEMVGYAKIGASSTKGIITTPTINLSGNSGNVTLTFDLGKYGSDVGLVQVLHAPDGTTFTQVGSDITPPATLTTQTIVITGGTVNSKIRIQAKTTSNNRFYLDNILVQYSTILPSYSDLIVNSTSQVVTGLLPNTNYYYRVRAHSASSTSANSSTSAVLTIPVSATTSITQPTCTLATGTIEITAPLGAYQYNIDGGTYQSFTIFSGVAAGSHAILVRSAIDTNSISAVANVTVDVQPPTPTQPIISVTQPTCTLATGTVTVTSDTTGLTFSNDGIDYSNTTGIFSGIAASGTYSITAKNSSGCVSTAATGTLVLQPVTPSQPNVGGLVQPTCTVTTGSIVLSNLPSGNWVINPGGITGSTSSITISGLTEGMYNDTYTVTNEVGCTSLPTAGFLILPQPSTPTQPTVSVIQPTCTVATGTITVTSSITGLTFSNDSIDYSNTTGIFSGIAAGGVYSITARNVSGCVSNAAIGTLNAQPVTPSIPMATTATSISTNNFTANWDVVSGATGYKIDVSTSNTFSSFVSGYNNLTVTLGTSQLITGLSTNATYYYRVRAFNSTCTSNSSGVIITNTLGVPTLTTTSISAITITTAVSGGNITADGGMPVTARGVCWNTTGIPTTADYTTLNASGMGSFVSNLSGLTAGTTYHLRAFAINSVGTAYGNEIVFMTTSGDEITVTNNNDAGVGSLREALANISNNGTINFASSVDGQIITLTTGKLIVNKNVNINNSNHNIGIIITGSVNNITINFGKSMKLLNGSKITVIGKINNNAGVTGLVIASGASFIHNNADVPATVQCYLNDNWQLIGSPFVKNTGATLSNLQVAGSIQMRPYNNGLAWGNNAVSPYTYLLPKVGYALLPSTSFIASLTGNLFYSPLSFNYSATLSFTGYASNNSWNLVANPYPSYINWENLDRTGVYPTMYVWDNSLYPNYSPLTGMSRYRTYNSLTGIGVPSNTTPLIAPFQGFFVKAYKSPSVLKFNPSARTHTVGLMKSQSTTEVLLRLKVETEFDDDELIICRNQSANIGFENYDSEKLFNGLPLEIYSQSSTGENLIINTINNTNAVIPIGMNGSVGAKAKITAFTLESGEQIYLEDRQKGKLISLSEGTTYEFEFPSEQVNGRFFIRFGNMDASLTNSDVKVFEKDNMLQVIAQTGEEIQEIEIFSLTGAKMLKAEKLSGNSYNAKIVLTPSVYMVRVKTSVSNYNVKVIWK